MGYPMRFEMLAAATVVALGTAVAANAATIDFTNPAVWVDGSSTATVLGATVSLSSVGGDIAQSAPIGPIGSLMGGSDGLGIGPDDEVGPNESITVSFSAPLLVTGFFFLDLYKSPISSDLESVIATFSTGDVIEIFGVQAKGFGFVDYSAFLPVYATSVTFTPGAGNDDRGLADFALAGVSVDVQPIPLPPAAWMLLASMAGITILGARKARA